MMWRLMASPSASMCWGTKRAATGLPYTMEISIAWRTIKDFEICISSIVPFEYKKYAPA
jgi:hypothetical protein